MKTLFTLFFTLVFFNQLVNAQYYKIELVKDINSGTAPSSPSSLTKGGNYLYFRANDDIHGDELWKSDGTEVETNMIADIRNGQFSSSPKELLAVGLNIFFAANDGTNGEELWRHQYAGGFGNGTTALVKNINTMGGSNPALLTNVNEQLFFTANKDGFGDEIWKSNGTTAGTVLVSSINPSTICEFNNIAYFATSNAFASGLFNSTPEFSNNPIPVTNYETQFLDPKNLIKVNNKLFMTGKGFQMATAVTGLELFAKNETGNIYLVKDILPGSGSSNPGNFTDVNGTLFFTAFNGTYNSLWKSDGSAAGTVLVKTIGPEPYFNFQTLGTTLYFFYDKQLWKSDGTSAGTVLVKNVNSTSIQIINFNGKIIFSTQNPFKVKPSVEEIWETDGTNIGTKVIKSFNNNTNIIPSIKEFTVVNDQLFFVNHTPATGVELFKMYNCYGPTDNYTLKNGNWGDPTVWSCGRVPDTFESVKIKAHTVNLNGNYSSAGIIFDVGGQLTIPTGNTLTKTIPPI